MDLDTFTRVRRRHGRPLTFGAASALARLAAVFAMPRQLADWYMTGEGAARIRWGTDGDLQRCHDLLMREARMDVTSDEAWGACNNLHKRLFGRPNDPND